MFMFDSREREIRRVLRRLSEQRIALILQPGNYWVIEKAIIDDEETDTALLTCYMRGWVEPIESAIPSGRINPDGSLPAVRAFSRVGAGLAGGPIAGSRCPGGHRHSRATRREERDRLLPKDPVGTD